MPSSLQYVGLRLYVTIKLSLNAVLENPGVMRGFDPQTVFLFPPSSISARKKQKLIIGPIPEKDLPAVLPVNFLPLQRGGGKEKNPFAGQIPA